jgi:small conductance mechanosensitive channel
MEQFDRLERFFVERGLDFFLAAVILLLGFIVSRIAKRWLDPILSRSRIGNDLLLKAFFLRTASTVVIIISFLASLGTVGFDVRAFLAGLGITGLILGFGLKDTLSNFASGLLLLIYRPFQAGEMIEVEGSKGVVNELTIVNMQMTTIDGIKVIMPNSKVWSSKIINYSVSERRRLHLTLRVSEDKIQPAIAAIKKALDEDSRVLKNPASSLHIDSISDKEASISIAFWVLPSDLQAASADIYLRMQTILKQNGIGIL